ncbi:hypothetical protein BH24ACT15_BH24ACT15_24700 [soil metagenome]
MIRHRLDIEDDGTVFPLFIVVLLVTFMAGVAFFQTGRASDLGAEAQTGSDAAALAAADDIRDQILEWVMTGAWNERPFVVNVARAAGKARGYAATNDVVISDFGIKTVGYLTFEVSVRSHTDRTLTPEGYRDVDPETGEVKGEFLLGGDERGVQDATAKVGPGAGSMLSGGFWTPGGGSGSGPGSGGGGTAPAGGCPVGDAELRSLADQAGVTFEMAQESYLRRYSNCDGPGVAVRPMQEAMKVSLLTLEAAMGEPLLLASGYRSPAYQARLCPTVAGPCAAPGRSMHNIGLAVDVVNYQAAAAAANADASIGLCQPLPSNDAVHLSHVTGRECGGRTGTAGGTGGWQPFGGKAQLTADAAIGVRLVK